MVDKSKSSFTITLMEDGDCEITAAEAIAEHEKSVDRLKGQLLDLEEGKARVDSITADQKRVKVKMASLGKKASAEAKKALQEKLDALELEYDMEEYQQLRKEWKDISADIRKQEKALAKLRKSATPSKEAAEATKTSPSLTRTRARKKQQDQEAMPAPAPVVPDERKSQGGSNNSTPKTKKKGRKDSQKQPSGKASTQLSLEDSFKAGTFDIRDQLTLPTEEQVELSAREASQAVEESEERGRTHADITRHLASLPDNAPGLVEGSSPSKRSGKATVAEILSPPSSKKAQPSGVAAPSGRRGSRSRAGTQGEVSNLSLLKQNQATHENENNKAVGEEEPLL